MQHFTKLGQNMHKYSIYVKNMHYFVKQPNMQKCIKMKNAYNRSLLKLSTYNNLKYRTLHVTNIERTKFEILVLKSQKSTVLNTVVYLELVYNILK